MMALMRRRLPWILLALAVAGAAAWSFGLRSFRTQPEPRTAAPRHEEELPWFEDVGPTRGVTFRHVDPKSELHLITETTGSGVAWIDYDNDGWPDLLCVQSCRFPFAPAGDVPGSRLYRNNRDGTFRDVTAELGLDCRGFGMGCAVGDFDNDGFDDLIITFFGEVKLYHNRPGGALGRKFVDVTAASGLGNFLWATSCAWADFDGDGLLDLYVCQYVVVDPAKPRTCFDERSNTYYECPPLHHPLTTHRIFRNTGNGRFEDVSKTSGVADAPPAAGLAVVAVDLDGDGRSDIYVANDISPAYLFHNQGGGRFVEKALPSGCALGPQGKPISGMGVVAVDLDGSGRPSLVVTDFQNAPNAVFLNRGGLRFDEAGTSSGLGPLSLPRLKWGIVSLDVNLDGVPDLAVASGHVYRNEPKLAGALHAQGAQLFLGTGGGRFTDASNRAGRDFVAPRAGRGLSAADFDNDGRPDLAINGLGEQLALLRNTVSTNNNWISLAVVGDGKKSNLNAIGAKVKVEAGGKTQYHWIVGGGSYLSASDRRLLIGLGAADKADKIIVRYPSGVEQTYTDVGARRWWRLREGNPVPEDATPKRPDQK
jgi:hypothetical protein